MTDVYYATWGGRANWMLIAALRGAHIPMPQPADSHLADRLPSPRSAQADWNQRRLCESATTFRAALEHVPGFPNTPSAGPLIAAARRTLDDVIRRTC
jgi:hypothetical protein